MSKGSEKEFVVFFHSRQWAFIISLQSWMIKILVVASYRIATPVLVMVIWITAVFWLGTVPFCYTYISADKFLTKQPKRSKIKYHFHN